MRLLFTTLCLSALSTSIYAQQKLIAINPGNDVLTSIPSEDLYAYRQFVEGVIHYKSGKTIKHKMNYNVLFDEMEYINSRGDTVEFNNHDFNFIALGKDIFYRDRFYYRVLKNYDKIKLITRNVFAFVNKEKTITDSIHNSYLIITNGAYLRGVAPKDTLRLTKLEMYYMTDLKNTIQALRRENLIKIYPHRRKALLNYLYEHPVHLDNLDEIEKMLDLLTAKKDN
jgi:hypothetical protein